jgi:hypothetical protein
MLEERCYKAWVVREIHRYSDDRQLDVRRQGMLAKFKFVLRTNGPALGLILGAAVASVSSAQFANAGDSLVTIRFGHVQSTTTFPLNLAIQSGIFKKRGLNVIAKPYADFSPLYLGYRSREIDMGSGGLGSIVDLNARGVPVKVIWGTSKMNNDILSAIQYAASLCMDAFFYFRDAVYRVGCV